MNNYTAATYGDKIAEVYDEVYPMRADVGATVAALAGLAGEGSALELGIGTGRVALPLAARGVEVHGIDASEAIVAKMQAKPGGDAVPVAIGDFSEFSIAGGKKFNLIYVVFNTLFQATSQDAQVQCFRSAAAHLLDDGVFVVEAFVPDPTRFERARKRLEADADIDAELLRLMLPKHDAVRQHVRSYEIYKGDAGISIYPVQVRYSWPSELDLMARLAGMRLRERWEDWHGAPFTASSENHISIYEKAV